MGRLPLLFLFLSALSPSLAFSSADLAPGLALRNAAAQVVPTPPFLPRHQHGSDVRREVQESAEDAGELQERAVGGRQVTVTVQPSSASPPGTDTGTPSSPSWVVYFWRTDSHCGSLCDGDDHGHADSEYRDGDPRPGRRSGHDYRYGRSVFVFAPASLSFGPLTSSRWRTGVTQTQQGQGTVTVTAGGGGGGGVATTVVTQGGTGVGGPSTASLLASA